MNVVWLRRMAMIAGVLLHAFFAATLAQAQPFPGRPITLIVPYAPGTGIDITARIIGQKLEERGAYTVVVKNQPGGSGNIGADAAAKSPPDGYTLVIMANSQIINQFISSNARDILKDFTPVAPAGTAPYVLAVPSSLGVSSIRELVALAKTKPGELNYAAIVASLPHMLGVSLRSSSNIDITLVSYKSTVDAMTDVLSGRVQIWFTTLPSALPHAKAGKVRILGVTGDRRSPLIPDVPTMTEAGFPDLDSGSELFIMAPAGTPSAITSKLNADIMAAVAAPDVQAKFAEQGIVTNTGSTEQLAARLRDEVDKWGRAVKASGIQKE
jgi:tripartite-type tricarboxylate transporter receptor subunit TctC